jgi:predicted transposase YbfD/YdcC
VVSSPKLNTSFRKFFPPQHLTVEAGHGRIEWRGIQVCSVTPRQMGFPHAVQVARLDRWRFHKKTGKQEVETVWVVTSLDASQANAQRLLDLVRLYWSIENGLHFRLDGTAKEDQCRVRHPVAATVYGILRRAMIGEYRAWAKHQAKARDRTCPTFKQKMSRRINRVMRYLNGETNRL